MLRRLLLLFLAGCWVTSDEVDEARARVVASPVNPQPVPTPVPNPTDPPPTPTGDPLPCVESDLVPGVIVEGNTTDGTDGLTFACFEDGELDVGYLFTPTVSGCHSIRARANDGNDIAIGVFDSCAADPEAACDAGHPTLDGSILFRPMVAGEGVIVGVERVEPGAFRVDAAPVFDEDMGSSDQLDGTNAEKSTNLYPRMCIQSIDLFGQAVGATYVRWVAPTTGTFEVRLSSDEMDPILSIHRACEPVPASQCSDAAGPGVTEFLEFDAETDEEILFRVASYGEPRGAYTLRVELVVNP